MQFVNFFVQFIITYYVVHILTVFIFRKKCREEQRKNIKLSKLRTIADKTIEQQKAFINLKYKKRPKKYKWKWSTFWIIIVDIILYIVIFQALNMAFEYFGIDIAIWQGIIFIIVGPLLMNMMLKKFNLQKDDLSYMLKFR